MENQTYAIQKEMGKWSDVGDEQMQREINDRIKSIEKKLDILEQRYYVRN